MKIIFWNTKKHADFSTIEDILIDEFPDLLFLAEFDQTIAISKTEELKKSGYEHFPNPGCSRIVIIKKCMINLSISRQDHYFSSVKDVSTNINIISVHLPSQMHQSLEALKSKIRDFRNDIDNTFGNSTLKDIIIIGDFNISPFEKAMIDFDGFSASNSKNLRTHATHLGSKKELYYNPTWVLFGKKYFPGTLYYRRPSRSSFDILEHHILDQVLISYSLNKKITSENLEVLESTSNKTFFDYSSNSVYLSDHLPIVYEFKM